MTAQGALRIIRATAIVSATITTATLAGGELRRGPYLQMPTPESITIRWRTDAAAPSVVRWGEQTNDLANAATNLAAVTDHEMRLTGLAAGTRYHYEVGTPDEPLASGAECTFVTPPAVGTAGPTRVWVTGDSGGAARYAGHAAEVLGSYRQYAGSNNPDVWLALGDNAYDTGTDADYQLDFFDVFAPLLQQVPVWSTIGNHDVVEGAPDPALAYLDLFTFPSAGEAGGLSSGSERYYAFDHANIHFICLDAMTVDRATNGAMAQWLRADLAANTNTWLIAFWHHAPYSKGSHDSDAGYETSMREMRENFLPLLETAGADLVLCGHSHNYERSYLLQGHYGFSTNLEARMIVDEGSGREDDTGAYRKPAEGPQAHRGTVYVVAGTASLIDLVDFGWHPAMFTDQRVLGSVVLDIASNRLDAIFLRYPGEIGDRFTLIKGPLAPLRLLPLQFPTGGVTVRWKSEPAQYYVIEYRDTGTWSPVSGIIQAAGETTAWTQPMTQSEAGFFRVRQLPPDAGTNLSTMLVRPAGTLLAQGPQRMGGWPRASKAGQNPGKQPARPSYLPPALAVVAENLGIVRRPDNAGRALGTWRTEERSARRRIRSKPEIHHPPWAKPTRMRG